MLKPEVTELLEEHVEKFDALCAEHRPEQIPM